MIEVPYWITRRFIQEHKELVFIYADDFKGNSYQGQAAHACGEPNAYPIPTKIIGLCRREAAYLSDDQYDLYEEKINIYFDRIPQDKPIVVFPKIGDGDSELKSRAPRLYKYIKKRLEKIESKEIRWI